jgi:hypothetical protein
MAASVIGNGYLLKAVKMEAICQLKVAHRFIHQLKAENGSNPVTVTASIRQGQSLIPKKIISH